MKNNSLSLRIGALNLPLSLLVTFVASFYTHAEQAVELFYYQAKTDINSEGYSLNYQYRFINNSALNLAYLQIQQPILLSSTEQNEQALELIKLGYSYPFDLNEFVEFELKADAVYSLSDIAQNDQILHQQGDVGVSYAAGLNWKLSQNLSLKIGLEKLQGLKNLPNFSLSYLGISYQFGSDAQRVNFNSQPAPTTNQITKTTSENNPRHLTHHQEAELITDESIKIQQQLTQSQPYYIQLGTFSVKTNAEQLANKLIQAGYHTQLKAVEQFTLVFVTGKVAEADNEQNQQSGRILMDLNQSEIIRDQLKKITGLNGLIKKVKK
ncbi:SPOR domain-containing protein [Catenovulum sp. 2E275]|uniref:SPOR domain-containing protein n=1 Tax=Catenovulum sp. 2E275 TaxID=2980497 RepID=UPI0021D04DAC|nr:SPOR domain-containing protein [Catenovulum sp. 2E275]MCU4676891.1 SPOR domain-containing protein [Catenovulum sp. 2E275]